MSKGDYKQLRIDRKYLIPYIQNLEKNEAKLISLIKQENCFNLITNYKLIS